jgi:hypothetical protein
MRSVYPDYADPATVKREIGGKVDADWIENTCAIRMSRAFNYSGVPIPRHFAGLNVVSGADHLWYAYRMQELAKWIQHAFGAASLTETSGKSLDRNTIAGMQGIIVFDIHFSDAQGHIDLWDGTTFTHERYAGQDYFAFATKIRLWKN